MVTVDEGVVHAGRRFFVTENPLFLLFYRHRETFDSSLACKQVACFFYSTASLMFSLNNSSQCL